MTSFMDDPKEKNQNMERHEIRCLVVLLVLERAVAFMYESEDVLFMCKEKSIR